jgi:NTE family protein
LKGIKLVLSGSGTKFPLFAGALKRLEEEGCVVEAAIGTSGGSIITAALGSGYSADEMIKLCKEIMPRLSKLVDFSFLRPLTDWGFVGGEKIKEELGKHFIELLGQSQIPIHITACNFDTEKLTFFSSKETPKLETKNVVRASISIPLFFVPEPIGGDLFVDGGVKKNFPIDFFGDSPDVVGLYFVDSPGRRPRPKGWKSLAGFIGRIINMLIAATTEDDIEDAQHTIQIPLKTKVNGLDFSFKEEEVQQMIDEGYACVDKWIKANPGRLG